MRPKHSECLLVAACTIGLQRGRGAVDLYCFLPPGGVQCVLQIFIQVVQVLHLHQMSGTNPSKKLKFQS